MTQIIESRTTSHERQTLYTNTHTNILHNEPTEHRNPRQKIVCNQDLHTTTHENIFTNDNFNNRDSTEGQNNFINIRKVTILV